MPSEMIEQVKRPGYRLISREETMDLYPDLEIDPTRAPVVASTKELLSDTALIIIRPRDSDLEFIFSASDVRVYDKKRLGQDRQSSGTFTLSKNTNTVMYARHYRPAKALWKHRLWEAWHILTRGYYDHYDVRRNNWFKTNAKSSPSRG